MMKSFFHTLWITGIRRKCPVCEQGPLFATYFSLHKTCSVCGARFERETGEATGGMSVSIVVLGVIFLTVYPLLEIFTDWSAGVHLAIWLPFSLIFPVLFYPFSRALWVVFLYLTNGIRQDTEHYQDTDLSMIDAFRYRQEGTALPDKQEMP